MSLVSTMRAMRSRKSQKAARFTLFYVPQDERRITVGHLEFDGAMWTFRYDDEYKRQSDLRPIEGFDELEKIYHSSVLFPFFAVRIPDPGRDDVRRKLEEDRVRHPGPADLLRIFGRRVVSSPAFELVPA